VAAPERARVQSELDARPIKAIRDTAGGPATVATYTVLHGRDSAPEWGLAVCDLPEGDRCYAKVLDADLLEDIERIEWVGAPIELVAGEGGVNLVKA
jgi:acetyl-CoA C-acetyltransferase